MRYLFFDLEEATCKGGAKICEFGYVIADEDFTVLEKDNLIINPDISLDDWDPVVVNTILTRPIEDYEKGPLFDYYYEEIRKLISSSDYVIGHTLESDSKALNEECQRYHKASIDYDFHDIKEYYKVYKNDTHSISLFNMMKEFSIDHEGDDHDAMNDAYHTMLAYIGLLNAMHMNTEQLFSAYPGLTDHNENYEVYSLKNRHKVADELLNIRIEEKKKSRLKLEEDIRKSNEENNKKTTFGDLFGDLLDQFEEDL